jgi:hypothetical protein
MFIGSGAGHKSLRLRMSKQQPSQQDGWLASVLRLTAFPDSSENVSGEEWWQQTVGGPSDSQTKRRPIGLQEVGPFGSGQLVLTVEPRKIDWRLVPTPLEGELPLEEGIPFISEFSAELDRFLRLMFRWLESGCPRLRRLAFGAELWLPVENPTAGLKRLEPLLRSVTIDPGGTRDFFYQINRPRPSLTDIPGLHINRLSKWSIAKLAVGLISADQPFDMPILERYFCRLELDVNTEAEYTDTLPQDKLRAIFGELVDLGMEIASEGDIP